VHCGYYDSGVCRSCTLIESSYPDQLAAKDVRAAAVPRCLSHKVNKDRAPVPGF